MIFPAADWQTASPRSQGVDPRGLEDAVAYLREALAACGGIEEMAIIRHGRLLWQGTDIDRCHQIWSATKSFTSTVLGLLIDDGRCTLDTPAMDVVPALAEKYPGVKLRHLATMTSGYDAVGGSYGDDPDDGSTTPYDPAEPLFAPGTMYRYWDDAQRLQGLVLTKIAGEPMQDLFSRRIAEPIGMTVCQWHVQAVVDGMIINDSAGTLKTTARQIARLGLLYLNRGRWEGRQLLSEAYVAEATRVHVPADTPWDPTVSGRQARLDGRGVYGLNWWVNGVRPDGRRYWPAAPAATFKASGLMENVCFVIPDWQMVIARLSTRPRPENMTAIWNTFFEKLGAAL
ncbi:MAG: serine hydrolase [Planctomycetes bacterium]|nr:serine hydrolase [Planctomycetota bacterium]